MKKNRYLLFLPILVILFLSSCSKKTYTATDITPHYYNFKKNKPVEKDEHIVSMIAPYKVQLDAEMNEVLINSTMELTKGKPNSTLGNWIADIILDESKKHFKGKLHFGFQNYGGLRISSIQAGPVTKGKIYEVMPFENMAVILHLKGSKVTELCDRIAAYGGWPTSHGISFEIDGRKAKNIIIDGDPIDQHKIYNVLIADYVANGGDSCDFLIDTDRTELGILIRDLIIDHLRSQNKQGKNIHVELEERIKTK